MRCLHFVLHEFHKNYASRSFVRSLRAGVQPTLDGPQRYDLFIGQMRKFREKGRIGRCVRCMCALCWVEEGLSRREQLVRYF